MRGVALILLVAMVALASVPSALAATGGPRKLALVIGNDRYENFVPLERAVADARAYRSLLQDLRGFEVVYVENADRRTTYGAVFEFLNRIQPGDTTMVVYAGHGVQLDPDRRDTLFLLPTDIPNNDPGLGAEDAFLSANAIRFAEVSDWVKQRGAKLSIFVLDACRDNPFGQRPGSRSVGLSRGLGRLNAGEGEFVFFAAAPGEQALDRLPFDDDDPNSVFTRAFLKHFRPNTYLEDVANNVQAEVLEMSMRANLRQAPYYTDGVAGKTCIDADCSLPTPAAMTVAPAQTPAPQTASPSIEETFWRLCETSSNPAYCEAYVEQYPEGPRVLLARLRLSELARSAGVDAEAAQAARADAEAARAAEAARLEQAAARAAEEAEARRRAEAEAARLTAELEARRAAEAEARRLAEEAEARRQAAYQETEQLRAAKEAEAARLAAEAEARRQAEAEAERLAAEIASRRAAQAEAAARAEQAAAAEREAAAIARLRELEAKVAEAAEAAALAETAASDQAPGTAVYQTLATVDPTLVEPAERPNVRHGGAEAGNADERGLVMLSPPASSGDEAERAADALPDAPALNLDAPTPDDPSSALRAAAWQTLSGSLDLAALRDFAASHPDTEEADAALERADEIIAFHREGQAQLNRAGYWAGPTDGIWGPKSARALRRYERAEGLDQTGVLTETLLTRLRAEPTARRARTTPRPAQNVGAGSGSTASPPATSAESQPAQAPVQTAETPKPAAPAKPEPERESDWQPFGLNNSM